MGFSEKSFRMPLKMPFKGKREPFVAIVSLLLQTFFHLVPVGDSARMFVAVGTAIVDPSKVLAGRVVPETRTGSKTHHVALNNPITTGKTLRAFLPAC